MRLGIAPDAEFQETPPTTAQTGVRPHGRVTGGASLFGIGAKVHPPLPGYRTSVLAKGPRRSTERRCFAICRWLSPSASSQRRTRHRQEHSHSSSRARQKDLKSGWTAETDMHMFDVQGIEILAPVTKCSNSCESPVICRDGPMRLCLPEMAAPGSRRPRERSILFWTFQRMPRRPPWTGGSRSPTAAWGSHSHG
jgi:hypothetical protein